MCVFLLRRVGPISSCLPFKQGDLFFSFTHWPSQSEGDVSWVAGMCACICTEGWLPSPVVCLLVSSWERRKIFIKKAHNAKEYKQPKWDWIYAHQKFWTPKYLQKSRIYIYINTVWFSWHRYLRWLCHLTQMISISTAIAISTVLLVQYY